MINELLNFAGDFTVSFQDEEIHFGGTLRKQGANIILECRATPETKRIIQCQEDFQVYGTVAGKGITLLECYVSNAKLIGINFDEGKFTLKPFEIVVGRKTKEPITVTRITTSITELNWMFSTRALEPHVTFSKENPSLLSYTFPEAITAQDLDGQLRIDRSISISNKNNTFSFGVEPFIEISFNTPTLISDAVSKVASARNLFSFFSDYYLPLGELTFSDEKETEHDDCELYQNYEETIHIPNKPFLICSGAFQENFQSIWEKWNDFYRDNTHIAEMFYEVITNHSLKINRFLNFCQCLETYSCCYRTEEAKKVKANDPDKPRSITLKHRIEDLLLELSAYLRVSKEQCDELAKTISNARNYYTHYDKKRTKPSVECISASIELLHLVLLVMVYKLIGIPQDAITACKQYAPYKNMDHIISNIKQLM